MSPATWYLIAALWASSLVLTWLGLRVIRGRVPDPEEQAPVKPPKAAIWVTWEANREAHAERVESLRIAFVARRIDPAEKARNKIIADIERGMAG